MSTRAIQIPQGIAISAFHQPRIAHTHPASCYSSCWYVRFSIPENLTERKTMFCSKSCIFHFVMVAMDADVVAREWERECPHSMPSCIVALFHLFTWWSGWSGRSSALMYFLSTLPPTCLQKFFTHLLGSLQYNEVDNQSLSCLAVGSLHAACISWMSGIFSWRVQYTLDMK